MFKFEGGSISKDDWEGMKWVLDQYKPKSVLEFGVGISTQLFCEYGLKVVSFETSQAWIDKAECPADIRLWDNNNLDYNERHDIAFVDGAEPRTKQIEIAKRLTDKIIFHDGQRDRAIIDPAMIGWKEIPIKGTSRFFIRDGYGAIVSCTNNYTQYLTAQLNSFNKFYTGDFHLIAIDISEDYLKEINKKWNFNLIIHRTTLDDIEKELKIKDKANLAKMARYLYLYNGLMDSYKAIVMLDVDLMLVRNIDNFFRMVEDKEIILGVNEGFKWYMNLYRAGQRTFPEIPMMWMICNAPLFFCPAKNRKFIDIEREIMTDCWDIKKNIMVPDLLSMNIALYVSGAYQNLIPLPYYAWTGVHNSYINIYTKIRRVGGEWWSVCGEPVYMLHGRWDVPNSEAYYLTEQEKRLNELDLNEEMKQKIRNSSNSVFKQIREQYNEYIK